MLISAAGLVSSLHEIVFHDLKWLYPINTFCISPIGFRI